jgi:hypothetical protein
MNTNINKRIMAVIASVLIISTSSFSQLDAINGDFFKGGVNDGVKLLTAYITPWANAFGAGFNGGWYNTAKPHKLGGFDITISANIGYVPSSAQSVDLKTLGFQTLTLVNQEGSGLSPTIAGSPDKGPQLHAMAGTIELANFGAPEGLNLSFMPVPVVQAGIGLPLGTELKVRYFPKINLNDYEFGLWGLGLEHSIMQYVPGNDLLPFDVSVFGGYSKLSSSLPISVQPTSSGAVIRYSTYNPLTSFTNQAIATTVQAWNLSLIGSVKLAVLTVYGGLGYSKTSTSIKFSGNYPLPRVNTVDPLVQPVVYEDAGVEKNIPSVDIPNFSGLRANIGIRLKLAILTLHGDYTRSQYNVISAGIGMSFR